MKQIDNRQKQVVQSRAQRTLVGLRNFFKKKEHVHAPVVKSAPAGEEQPEKAQLEAVQPVEYHPGPKFGRNDPCPCGSGKKYKKCCLNSPK
jgi:uncharacterized protein YecA (UPF0149 family)